MFLFLASPPLIHYLKGWVGGNRAGFVQHFSGNSVQLIQVIGYLEPMGSTNGVRLDCYQYYPYTSETSYLRHALLVVLVYLLMPLFYI